MDNKDINLDVTPEEQTAEVEAQKQVKEDEIRAEVITEYGFDEENDGDKIEKAVKREVTHREKLSGAIGQKIKYRDALKANPPKPKDDDKGGNAKVVAPEEIEKTATGAVNKALEQRDLDDMELPDEIKTEIKRIAEIQGVSVKKAARDPYIVSKIDEHKKAQKADDASISNKKNQGGGKKSWDPITPPNVDMSTPEGRKEYDEWKQWSIKQGN